MKKELEFILDASAKKVMKGWNLENFKKTHPSLFDTIIIAMTTVITGETCTAHERVFLNTFIELDKKGLPQFCDMTERKFLDEIREKGKWETFKKGTGIKINSETKIMQKDFPQLNLIEFCGKVSQ